MNKDGNYGQKAPITNLITRGKLLTLILNQPPCKRLPFPTNINIPELIVKVKTSGDIHEVAWAHLSSTPGNTVVLGSTPTKSC